MSGSQTISSISLPEICRIDFKRLCDNNDFAAMTDNYEKKQTRDLIHSVSNEQLRECVIDAILLEKKLQDNIDFDEMLSIEKQQSILQQKCRNTFELINNKNKQDSIIKGLSARQIGIFGYYNAEVNGVYIGADDASITQEQVKASLVDLFGISPANLQGMIVPDIDNKQTRKDMKLVAKIVNKPFPKLSEKINEVLDNYE